MGTKTFIMENLHLRLTSKCNKQCIHCFAHINNEAEEQPLSYWVGIVDAAIQMGTKNITLTGGEPFVYHDIRKLIDHIKKKPINFSIETNGIIVHKYAIQLSTIKNLKRIAISPDLTYTEMELDQLLADVIQMKNIGLPIILQATVLPGNKERILQWIEKFARNGIPSRLILGHNGLGQSENLKENLSYDDMIAIGNKYKNDINIRCDLPGCVVGGARNQTCGWNTIRGDILPNGHLSPCAAIAWNNKEFELDYVDGNNLKTVWEKNLFLNKIRNITQNSFGGNCKHCKHFDECKGSCVATSLGLRKSVYAGYPLCDYYFGKKKHGKITDNSK